MVDKNQIDPELIVALDDVPDFDIWEDLEKTRAVRRKMAEDLGGHISILDQVLFQDHEVPAEGDKPSIRVRAYRPENTNGPLPALLWIHGGGYVMGTIDTEVPLMQHIVDAVGCIVVSVEYRLAPEHPFPAPLDDCYRALAWTFENAAKLNIDANRIAIVEHRAHEQLKQDLQIARVARQQRERRCETTTGTDAADRNELPSTHMDLTGIGWTRESNINGWSAYLGGDYDAAIHQYAAPARIEDLAGLPPAYISIGTLDVFLDEDLQYARRLMAAGVATELHTFPGAMHAFEYRAPGARVSRRAHYLNYDILRHAFSSDTNHECD